jgi:hypothetical protein
VPRTSHVSFILSFPSSSPDEIFYTLDGAWLRGSQFLRENPEAALIVMELEEHGKKVPRGILRKDGWHPALPCVCKAGTVHVNATVSHPCDKCNGRGWREGDVLG